jgi:hypothetical protein
MKESRTMRSTEWRPLDSGRQFGSHGGAAIAELGSFGVITRMKQPVTSKGLQIIAVVTRLAPNVNEHAKRS